MLVSNRHRDAWQAIRSEDGSIRYLSKYALKTYQKEVPVVYRNVGRFWGASRGVASRKIPSVKLEMSGADLRVWLASIDHTAREWDVVPKFLFGLT